MSKPLHGVVRGLTIELSEPSKFNDGERVEVILRTMHPTRSWEERVLASAGGWAEYPELDEVMHRIQQDRKSERTPQDAQ